MKELPILTSNEVEISSGLGNGVEAFFNRGLISTQRVSRFFTGPVAKQSLLDNVAIPGNALRDGLSGDMVDALTGFLGRAGKAGKIYAALYELGDVELLKGLVDLKGRLSIILSDAKAEEEEKDKPKVMNKNGKMVYPKKKVDANQSARLALVKSHAKKWDRIMPNNHIGHNKFLVHVDAQGKARAVLLGSTNWTSTGLCTQTNNTLIIEDVALASRYLDYWNQLKKDTDAAKGVSNALQGAVLRAWDAKGRSISSIAGAKELSSWFSPNTPKARSSNKSNEATPPDMKTLIDHINGAQHAILFLAFYPGTPSVAKWTAQALKKKKDLFVRGCVTNRSASGEFFYELSGIQPPKKEKGVKTPVKQDYRVFAAEAFDGDRIPKGWKEELLNAGHAVVHDKIMVIDPFSEDCVVATGSHNLGFKASYDNDENLVIIKGNRKLALAYATHVLDVYDHFSFRYWSKHNKMSPDYYLEKKPEDWLTKYYDGSGKVKNAQLKFWLQGSTAI
jgi:phosphatidylserine/phosphatidylglycerophosphate/cardiolipin synthase-like enzyme